MQRSPRQVGLTAVTVLTMAFALTIVTGPVAVAGPPLSCAEDIPAYLVGIGVNPNDAAKAICQEGLRNYAGPACPGKGWNCVKANVPIVQIANLGGTNLFYCTALNCLVVQVAHNGGQNASACERRVEGPTETLMFCSITQATGPGTNAATISQHIQQSKGVTQRAREVARITQVNETGSNIARIIQGIGQSSRAKGGLQLQEAHQAATVTQTTEHDDSLETSTLGNNTSNIRQTQDQLQRASGGSIEQKQNTEPGSDPAPGDFFCDGSLLGGTPAFDQEKNQCAEVTQHSSLVPGVGGANRSTLTHQIGQRQTAEGTGTVSQSQGASSTGEGGVKDQLSSGVSTGTATQDMLQDQTAPPDASVSQTQNTGDPRCCWAQFGNPANSAEIIQVTNQSSSSGGIQSARLQADCDSSGTCHVEQSATTNNESGMNDCTNSSCHEELTCFEGEGSFCSDDLLT
jgi:hypothetical protein